MNTDISRLKRLPPELVGEIGQLFFRGFILDKEVIYDDLLKLSPYISYLDLGYNNNIEALPPDLLNLKTLLLGWNSDNPIKHLPDLPNLHTLDLGRNDKIVSLPPNLPNLQNLYLGANNKIEALPDLPNLQKLYLGWNMKIVALPNFLPNLLRP